MKHLLLEVYCDCESCNEPSFCSHGANNPGSHCFENNCKFLSYTNCPNEISYSGDSGIVESVEDYVGFGGDMLPEPYNEENKKMLIKKWKEICISKISQAYNEYMKLKNQLSK